LANVETETARVSVPIETVVMSELLQRRWQGSRSWYVNFGEGEVARMKSTQRLLTFIKKHLYVKSESTKWWIRKRLAQETIAEKS